MSRKNDYNLGHRNSRNRDNDYKKYFVGFKIKEKKEEKDMSDAVATMVAFMKEDEERMINKCLESVIWQMTCPKGCLAIRIKIKL